MHKTARPRPVQAALLAVLAALQIAALLAAMTAPPAYAKEEKYASLVIDADSGAVISERYADEPRYPASLTKIMTLLMVFEALERKEIRLNDRIRISAHAQSMSPSKLNLGEGATIRVEDAILALVTKSANDIAAAVAEHLGGTEYKFGQMMTRRAHEIGMKSTTFVNASGLHNPRQKTTARDMVQLGRYMLMRYPHYYRYFSTKQFTYRGQTYGNHNRLMSSYDGMDGIKTGYINASGFNLLASAKQDGRRLIGVVFGGRTTATRNAHMREILDAGFERIDDIRIAAAPLPPRKPAVSAAQQLAQTGYSADQTSAATTLAALSAQRGLSLGETDGATEKVYGEGDYDYRLPPGAPAPAGTLIPGHAMAGRAGEISRRSDSGTGRGWSIQVGAYTSRVATDDALRTAKGKLPQNLSAASTLIVPLKTADGILYRARLGNLNEAEAKQACALFSECLTISP